MILFPFVTVGFWLTCVRVDVSGYDGRLIVGRRLAVFQLVVTLLLTWWLVRSALCGAVPGWVRRRNLGELAAVLTPVGGGTCGTAIAIVRIRLPLKEKRYV